MVELEGEPSAPPPSSTASDGAEGPEKLCRLCLQRDENEVGVDIFAEQVDEKGNKKLPLEQTLSELFQIKYDKSSSLPHVICQRCLNMVNAFSGFRQIVQKCEAELQRRQKSLKHDYHFEEEQRPGLNGQPGVFEPEDDCIITEVDPEQEYESSEDDFSMESDTDPEDIQTTAVVSNIPATAPQSATDVGYSVPGSSSTGGQNSFGAQGTLADKSAAEGGGGSKELASYAGTPASLSDSLEYATKNTYLCQYCDMAFTTHPDCAEHESRHDASAPFVCNFCPKRCTSRQSLISHIKEAHDPERPYVCALCAKGFCRRSDLKKHTIVHTGVRPFTCPICAKSFSRNTNLTKHMRIHSSIKPYVCQRCPRSFTTGCELLRHARSHTEIKPFQCSRCPASYTRKDKLQLHEQSHYRRESEFLMNQAKCAAGGGGISQAQHEESTENIVVPLNPYADNDSANQGNNEDPYRSSILANQLQQRPLAAAQKLPASKPSHPRLHTCDICAKSFTRERDLHRHQALHLDTLFTCKQCGVGFSRREKLARHELEQHAPQYSCDVCRISFSKRDELDVHQKMHELQQNVAMSVHQTAMNAPPTPSVNAEKQPPPPAPPLPPGSARQRPSAADISFYSNMVPTMNLGFYSETRPEDRNGI